jgi:chitinase
VIQTFDTTQTNATAKAHDSTEENESAMSHLNKTVFGLVFLILAGCGGGNGDSASNSISNNANLPIADAGHGQMVVTGTTVQLNGSTSFGAAGRSLTYRWTLSSKPIGSKSSVVSSTTATPYIVPDKVGTYVLALVVNDGRSSSQPAYASLVAVQGADSVIANAGAAQSVVTRSTVTLNGATSSGKAGNPLSYSWTMAGKPPGSNAALSADKTVTPSFVADVVGTYIANLIVTDGVTTSLPSVVVITAGTGVVAPIANPGGAQNVLTGTAVQLNGYASTDANGQALSYRWTLSDRPLGSTAALSSLTVANPTFVADMNGTYMATLVVSNGVLSSNPVSAVITASSADLAPVANAGINQSGFTGVKVKLDGGLSNSPSGSPLSYKWKLTARPPGSTAQLISFEMLNSGFLPDVSGSYVATLVVSDSKLSSQPSTVLINVAQSALTLMSVNPNGNQIQPWPYANSVSRIGSVTCADQVCADFSVASFQLQATGRTFTIANLAAVDLNVNTPITASIVGLTGGQVISSGQAVVFQLRSQGTGGQTVDLLYTFSILETGEVFSYQVQLKTN